MGEKHQRNHIAPPLVSDRIWAFQEGSHDWKIVGNASIGRMRARSVVGDMGLAKLGMFTWNGSYSNIGTSGYRRSSSVVCELPKDLEGSASPRPRTRERRSNSMVEGWSRADEQSLYKQSYKEICQDYYRYYSGTYEEEKDIVVESDTLSSLKNALEMEAKRDAKKEEKRDREKRKKTAAGSFICIVQFGSGRKCFGAYSGFDVEIGTFVIVEADRGEDCGTIVRDKVDIDKLKETDYENKVGSCDIKKVYRVATDADKIYLLEQNELELEAMMDCREKALEQSLPMEVVGAVYQWDRKKLTFYFKSSERIDFRDLVKELYKTYKTRIWMCAVEKGRRDKKYP